MFRIAYFRLCLTRCTCDEQLREAAGNCFVQVGLLYGELVTVEGYQHAAHRAMQIGGDCVYCASSFGTIKALADNGIPIVSHVGLIPSKATWTGGFKAVGKTAERAMDVFRHAKALEEMGASVRSSKSCRIVWPRRLRKRTKLVLLGMGAGPHADAQCLFAEDVLGYTRGHKPRHAKTHRNFRSELDRLQQERVNAFTEFNADVANGSYPATKHKVPISDDEFQRFTLELPVLDS